MGFCDEDVSVTLVSDVGFCEDVGVRCGILRRCYTFIGVRCGIL